MCAGVTFPGFLICFPPKKDNFALPFGKQTGVLVFDFAVAASAGCDKNIFYYSGSSRLFNLKILKICLAVKKENDIRSLRTSVRSGLEKTDTRRSRL